MKAVVLGANATGLGVIRSLAPHHIDLLSADAEFSEWGSVTALAKPVRLAACDAQSLVGLASFLDGPAMLYLTRDEDVIMVSNSREALLPYFRFSLPPRAVVDRLMDKTQFHIWALQHEYQVPQGWVVSDAGTLASARRAAGLPFVVKPYMQKTFLVKTADQLDEALDSGRLRMPFLIQRYVQGPDNRIVFCMAYFGPDGLCRSSFVGRKVRQWPLMTGSACRAVSEIDPDLENVSLEILGEAGLEGFGSIEYKYDETRRAFVIMEPTVGRVNLTVMLATAAGVNLPLAAIADETGETYISEQEEGVTWVHELNNLKYGLARGIYSKLIPSRDHVKVLWDPRDPATLPAAIVSSALRRVGRLFGLGRLSRRPSPFLRQGRTDLGAP